MLFARSLSSSTHTRTHMHTHTHISIQFVIKSSVFYCNTEIGKMFVTLNRHWPEVMRTMMMIVGVIREILYSVKVF